jgi:hypothetical protein
MAQVELAHPEPVDAKRLGPGKQAEGVVIVAGLVARLVQDGVSSQGDRLVTSAFSASVRAGGSQSWPQA